LTILVRILNVATLKQSCENSSGYQLLVKSTVSRQSLGNIVSNCGNISCVRQNSDSGGQILRYINVFLDISISTKTLLAFTKVYQPLLWSFITFLFDLVKRTK